MIVEYIRYRLEPIQSEAFLSAYTAASAYLRASVHCLGYDLSRCDESEHQFILRIEWDSSEGHLKGFRASEGFQPFLKLVQPYLANIEEMRHYNPTAIKWAKDNGT